ncbi:MAG TPA: hypothetical protein DEP05_06630 [Betaproteobacteria bacterium]|nr:hypothetical protein [Betaproteobacteria bacterium]
MRPIQAIELRALGPEDKFEFAEMFYSAFNGWYWRHGWAADYFSGGPATVEVFFTINDQLDPGCGIVAVNPGSGRMMGGCFYHPRARHVSIGSLIVHPNYFGRGVGKALLRHIVDDADRAGYSTLRMLSSTFNIDGFSLSNRAGFTPRCGYHGMAIPVPLRGIEERTAGMERVREATAADIPAIAALEMEMSGISREPDYRYAIEQRQEGMFVAVLEGKGGGLDGYMVFLKRGALSLLGPGVARTAHDAASLLLVVLDRFKGLAPMVLAPMAGDALVTRLYHWGARNIEIHMQQVRGVFQPCAGVNFPGLLPETG